MTWKGLTEHIFREHEGPLRQQKTLQVLKIPKLIRLALLTFALERST